MKNQFTINEIRQLRKIYDKAIEQGFVKYVNDIDEAFHEAYPDA